MAGLYLSDIASTLVKENLASGEPTDLVFRAPDMLMWLMSMGAVKSGMGGAPYQWNVITAANGSAEIYTENQAFPAAGQQTYVRASVNPFFARVIAKVTGHVRAQDAAGGTVVDSLELELRKGVIDLIKKCDDQLCGSTADQGILSAIDAGDTYAGIVGSAPWASLETAINTALSVAALDAAFETINISPYVGSPTHLLVPRQQLTNYTQLVGPAAGTSLVRFQGNSGYDLGLTNGMVSYNGVPFQVIRGITSTVILGVDMTASQDGGPGICVYEHVPVTTTPIGRTEDAEAYDVKTSMALIVKKRNAHFKLTGVTI